MSTDEKVIVLGASPERWRFGNKAVRCYRDAGYRVFPVHPTATAVEGFAVHRTIADVPEDVALLLLYVKPAIGLQCIEAAPARGVRRVILNPGASSAQLVARIEALGMEPVETCAKHPAHGW